MAPLKVMDMAEMRLEILLEVAYSGASVAEVCRRHGISRQSFYVYRRRFEAEGLEGLEPRSRRPRRSAGQIAAGLELEICRFRKDHPGWGARRIRAELARVGWRTPAVSTIHQVLVRNHLVAPQPTRRDPAPLRFERAHPNDLWQIDATRVVLADEHPVWVMDLLDDHARYLLAAVVADQPTGQAAWRCFETAMRRYGVPHQLLSDNGSCFTGRFQGAEVDFERRLKALGVITIHARPYHPQTLGKLERFHRTLKEWLAERPAAQHHGELQGLLNQFRRHYNQERPHQGIADQTPAQRYQPGPSPQPEPAPASPTYPPHATIRKVSATGCIGYHGYLIGLGLRWVHATVMVTELDRVTHIYLGDTLIRSLLIDPNRYYQPKTPTPTRPTTKPKTVN
jgi:transposase InsO family protein